ncbi:hypothetical protein [Halohasta litorea]|uniref:Uncharacterized protein n=1 Tax=Halohasta litorea TaxID=869891 RepID=A0ABD6DE02_9EURY|nr:hypothetical protein [Halohasta litorea]
MSDVPYFISDSRDPSRSSWSDDEDWNAGESSNLDIGNGELIGRVPVIETSEVPADGISHAWTDITYTSYEGEWSIEEAAPTSSEFRIEMEVTQNGGHNGDESVKVEMGLRMKDADGFTTDTLSTSVTFGGSTSAGTTKSTSVTGTVTAGTDWVLFIKGYHAPTTPFGPNAMNADASVALYD